MWWHDFIAAVMIEVMIVALMIITVFTKKLKCLFSVLIKEKLKYTSIKQSLCIHLCMYETLQLCKKMKFLLIWGKLLKFYKIFLYKMQFAEYYHNILLVYWYRYLFSAIIALCLLDFILLYQEVYYSYNELNFIIDYFK